MSRLYDFIYHVRWCTYIKHDGFHDFSRGLAEKCKEKFSFRGGMSERGYVKHLERGAFFALKLGNVFRMVSENEFMKIVKNKKLATE